mmetsp:Transcript_5738/g.14951  ORF Transcript_5738/g.14951 Transcript_5738/m.14951 type:complete len:614 (-) Transcript_5738:591-2432(-)
MLLQPVPKGVQVRHPVVEVALREVVAPAGALDRLPLRRCDGRKGARLCRLLGLHAARGHQRLAVSRQHAGAEEQQLCPDLVRREEAGWLAGPGRGCEGPLADAGALVTQAEHLLQILARGAAHKGAHAEQVPGVTRGAALLQRDGLRLPGAVARDAPPVQCVPQGIDVQSSAAAHEHALHGSSRQHGRARRPVAAARGRHGALLVRRRQQRIQAADELPAHRADHGDPWEAQLDEVQHLGHIRGGGPADDHLVNEAPVQLLEKARGHGGVAAAQVGGVAAQDGVGDARRSGCAGPALGHCPQLARQAREGLHDERDAQRHIRSCRLHQLSAGVGEGLVQQLGSHARPALQRKLDNLPDGVLRFKRDDRGSNIALRRAWEAGDENNLNWAGVERRQLLQGAALVQSSRRAVVHLLQGIDNLLVALQDLVVLGWAQNVRVVRGVQVRREGRLSARVSDRDVHLAAGLLPHPEHPDGDVPAGALPHGAQSDAEVDALAQQRCGEEAAGGRFALEDNYVLRAAAHQHLLNPQAVQVAAEVDHQRGMRGALKDAAAGEACHPAAEGGQGVHPGEKGDLLLAAHQNTQNLAFLGCLKQRFLAIMRHVFRTLRAILKRSR